MDGLDVNDAEPSQEAAPPPAVAWFNCFCGVAGDMALGALIDAGAAVEEVCEILEGLEVPGWELVVSPTLRGGIAASDVTVRVSESGVVRTATHILGLIGDAELPERARRRSLAVFRALATVEAKLHGRPVEQVHFHEVGGLDAIVDIVGTCAALEVLNVAEVHVSPIAQGQGMIRTAHGHLPIPAPATVELLRGAPTFGTEVPAELTTPTGAALMAALAAGFGPMPPMTVTAVGYGAGDRELQDRPNVTQAVIGRPEAALSAGQEVQLLETNVDDVTGETLAYTIQALLRAGAHDAWITPVVMKKGRLAHVVSALVDPAAAAAAADVMLAETGSLGVRATTLQRWPRAREQVEVRVEDLPVRLKVAPGRVKVEHDDAAEVAAVTGRPLREVIEEAREAWQRPHAAPDIPEA
ncbi:MAG: nickel pincer cofactor biosynthesis protein LarC [Acidimicrobiia bacterium]|nr:nickel pincer cofactor biosynthesis protein LarC [bacterium]MXZ29761.1 nickel pincer cofactor biosynthesis protein LarC [Acidimicrobiia bacterium]MYJ13090.1 nickel pincer cofactor biosynthesis protein LarC [Acidimicrobiia bacterium]